MTPPSAKVRHGVRHWNGTAWVTRDESIVPEAPLQILVNGERFATTMRSPGQDDPLVRGLLFTEGIVPAVDAAAALQLSLTDDPETGYVGAVDAVTPPDTIEVPVADARSGLMSAACGVCGTRDASRLAIYGTPIAETHTSDLSAITIGEMQRAMREKQETFSDTGGSHAAAAFDADGTLLASFEDVGRHNAVDKVIGQLIGTHRLAAAHYMTVSGRASYEMVYKAYRASIGCLCAVSAPSSMAITCAERFGIALVGFCRDGRATVYTHSERIR